MKICLLAIGKTIFEIGQVDLVLFRTTTQTLPPYRSRSFSVINMYLSKW